MGRWRESRTLAPVLAFAMLVSPALTACGGGGVGTANRFDVEIREPSPGEVRISSPSSVGSGLVELRIKNSGESVHEAQLVRVEDERTRDDVLDYFRSTQRPSAPIPAWIREGGGAAQIPPGETVSVMQRLSEGQWYLADAQAPEGPGNPPSFLERGGLVAFTVTSGGSAADLPDADARITARDHTFAARGLRPGTQSVRFDNRGRQLHHVVAAPLRPGRTVEDARAFFLASGTSTAPPPLDLDASVALAMIDRGESVVTDLRLTRGTWILACFISDRTGGPPHVSKGMLHEIKVG